MGMDVFGRDATEEAGEYFRASIWMWRPLWAWTVETCDLDNEAASRGQFNEGWGPQDQQTCTAWADLLAKEIDSGSALRLQQEYELVELAEREAPSQPCPRCKGTGKDPETGADCNPCKGKGKVEDFKSWYTFDVQVAQQWVQFLRSCGGFEVW